MYDLKPGDEVVCVWPGPWNNKHGRWFSAWLVFTNRVPLKGVTYTVTQVATGEGGVVGVDLRECPTPKKPKPMLWAATCFRKVQRRDLSAWLKTSVGNTDKLDKRAPAKEGV